MKTLAKLSQYWSIFILLGNFAMSCFWIGLKHKYEEIKLALNMIKEFNREKPTTKQ